MAISAYDEYYSFTGYIWSQPEELAIDIIKELGDVLCWACILGLKEDDAELRQDFLYEMPQYTLDHKPSCRPLSPLSSSYGFSQTYHSPQQLFDLIAFLPTTEFDTITLATIIAWLPRTLTIAEKDGLREVFHKYCLTPTLEPDDEVLFLRLWEYIDQRMMQQWGLECNRQTETGYHSETTLETEE